MSIDPRKLEAARAYWASPNRDQIVADHAQADAARRAEARARIRAAAFAREERHRQEREADALRKPVKARLPIPPQEQAMNQQETNAKLKQLNDEAQRLRDAAGRHAANGPGNLVSRATVEACDRKLAEIARQVAEVEAPLLPPTPRGCSARVLLDRATAYPGVPVTAVITLHNDGGEAVEVQTFGLHVAPSTGATVPAPMNVAPVRRVEAAERISLSSTLVAHGAGHYTVRALIQLVGGATIESDPEADLVVKRVGT